MARESKGYSDKRQRREPSNLMYSEGSVDSTPAPQTSLKAYPIPLDRLHADPRQPRRAVPPALRGTWDGSPSAVVDLLTAWRKVAAARLQQPIDVHKLVLQRDERVLEKVDADDPIAFGFLRLVRLATSIHHEGLANPPTVARQGDVFRLVAGERRTLAYHLLLAVTGDDRYSAIPAFKDDRHDIWKQAAENNARDELTAVGLARQIALLLIDLYEAEGYEFEDYHALRVPVGTDGAYSDRPYYAQVADGHQFRIPYGEGQRVQDAMGLSSRRMLSAYRALLTVPDRLWLLADNYDFAEGRMRDAVKYMTDDEWRHLEDLPDDNERVAYIVQAIRNGKGTEEIAKQEEQRSETMLPIGNNVANDDTLPIGKHDDDDTPPGGHPAPTFDVTNGIKLNGVKLGDQFTLDGESVTVTDIKDDGRVCITKPNPNNGGATNVTTWMKPETFLAKLLPSTKTQPTAPLTVTRNGWQVGDRCTVKTKGPGEVIGITSPVMVSVRLDDTGNIIAVHENDLTPLRDPAPAPDKIDSSSPQWADPAEDRRPLTDHAPSWRDPAENRVPVEPSHTPIPGGRSGDTREFVQPERKLGTEPRPQGRTVPLDLRLTDAEREAVAVAVWLAEAMPVSVDRNVALKALEALQREAYALQPGEKSADRTVDHATATAYLHDAVALITQRIAAIEPLLTRVRNQVQENDA